MKKFDIRQPSFIRLHERKTTTTVNSAKCASMRMCTEHVLSITKAWRVHCPITSMKCSLSYKCSKQVDDITCHVPEFMMVLINIIIVIDTVTVSVPDIIIITDIHRYYYYYWYNNYHLYYWFLFELPNFDISLQVMIIAFWILAAIACIPNTMYMRVNNGYCYEKFPKEWVTKAYTLWNTTQVFVALLLMVTLYSRVVRTLWFKSNIVAHPVTSQQKVSTLTKSCAICINNTIHFQLCLVFFSFASVFSFLASFFFSNLKSSSFTCDKLFRSWYNAGIWR